MRLVHLAPYALPQSGSFVPFLRSVLVAASERGWRVEAVLPEEAREQPWIGDLQGSGVKIDYALGSRRELTAWLGDYVGRGNEPTILHTHFTVYDVAAALVARSRPNVKVFWHVHTVLSRRPHRVLANSVKFGGLGRNVDRILVPSADMAQTISKRLGARSEVEVFPNPIDPDRFPPFTDEQRAAARSEFGVPRDAEVLLLFGRNWQLKGGDLFLDVIQLLRDEGRNVVGLVNQGGEVAQREIERRGLEDHTFAVGMIPQPQSLYAAADVLVAPSRGEGMPYTVVESLCSGTPVVASDVAGHRFVGDEVEACTVVPRDSVQMADAVGSYLDRDADERTELVSDARAWIVKTLDLRAAATRLVDDYELAIASMPNETGNGNGASGSQGPIRPARSFH